MIVLDSSFLYALLDRREPDHAAARSWYEQADDEIATTPLVLCELDYLTESRLGRYAQGQFRADVAAGAYLVDWWPGAATQAVDVAERYVALGVSLTDASLIALAARLETTRIATFDERHFRAVEPLTRAASFTLLPTDSA